MESLGNRVSTEVHPFYLSIIELLSRTSQMSVEHGNTPLWKRLRHRNKGQHFVACWVGRKDRLSLELSQ
jgi:hypothetical protein